MSHPFGVISLACAALLAAASVQSGCQRAETLASRGAPDGEIIHFDRNGDRMPRRDTAAGVHDDEQLPLPMDFPGDVYLPGHYAVHSVMDMPGMQVISLLAPGRVATLSGDARQAMERDGWTRRMAMQHSVDNAVLAFEKDRRSALLAFNANVQADGLKANGVIVSVQLEDRAVQQ